MNLILKLKLKMLTKRGNEKVNNLFSSLHYYKENIQKKKNHHIIKPKESIVFKISKDQIIIHSKFYSYFKREFKIKYKEFTIVAKFIVENIFKLNIEKHAKIFILSFPKS